jgi:hypothetical protein
LHDPLAPPDARFPVGLFILLVFLVLWYELPIFVRQSKTSTMQKLEIKDLGFGDAFKHLEVTLSDGTEALIPAEEICEGETPNELGEYSVTNHDDFGPVRFKSYDRERGMVWDDVTTEKGAYETLDEMSDAEIIDLAVKYAAEKVDAYWSVTGDKAGFKHRVTTHQIPALNFTHLAHVLRDWEIIESVKQNKEQAAIAA